MEGSVKLNKTPIYKLGKPLCNEKYSISVQNDNMDIIENELNEISSKIDNIVSISENEIIELTNSI